MFMLIIEEKRAFGLNYSQKQGQTVNDILHTKVVEIIGIQTLLDIRSLEVSLDVEDKHSFHVHTSFQQF